MHKNFTPAPSPSSPSAAAGSPRGSRLGRFGVLPQLAGSSFLVIAFFARLPLAMLTVGALTLVTTASGSYAAGGFAAGAVGLGSALGAPLLGFLADKRGQRIVLLASAVLNTLAIVGLLLVTSAGAGFPGLAPVLVSALAMGFTCPQIGPLARVRWMAMTRRGPRSALDTALSYEGTADELTFVLGPALVGLLASVIAPWLPLALAAALTLTLVSAFAVHRTVAFSDARRSAGVGTPPGPDAAPVFADEDAATPHAVDLQRSAEPDPAPPGAWLVLLPVAGMIAMGTFFGSTQTFLTAFTGRFGAAEAAGLLYAVMGLSSAVAALSVAYWSRRFRHTARWSASAIAMTAAASALAVPSSIGAMVLVLLILGLSVGPTMVTIFSIGSAVAPPHRLGTVMTLLASGIVAGTAIGSALAGTLAEAGGASGAVLVPALAAGVLLLLGATSAVALRRVTDA